MIKSGIGYDVHSLSKGEELIIGGVKINSPLGAVGHSDGDVLLHAIVDALLGAANLGDIGVHFASSDKRWKNKESIYFLEHAAIIVREQGFDIDYVDSTIILEAPKLADIRIVCFISIPGSFQRTTKATRVSSRLITV